MSTAIIILAAGNSSRMGKPKQLLNYNGQTFLDIVITESAKTTFYPIIVVLGAYAAEIKQSIADKGIFYVVNENWESGMSSSISFGLQSALNIDPEIENVILTVADQVHISSEIFEALNSTHQFTNKSIVTCAYSKTTGSPSLFNKKYFEELLNLTGETGAKPVIKQYITDTATIPFELGKVDIDTETDYKKLINNK
ncbi:MULTISPECIES: NTP transferase domain-containing protein [Pedobacter]|uniref:nucleotidyltransferase family protein n=1 Tax=Pedobacter TaxID=84567 RepID=UPI001E3A0098|nr:MULTISPECIES: nucleotidyltransferase family protein [Pedobacter]